MLACVVSADFAAQAEQLLQPARAPLLLTTGTRPVIAALDAQADAQGVRRGMPLKRAKALCPEAEVRPLVEARLRPAFEALLAVASEFATRFELQPSAGGSDPVLWLDWGSAADARTTAFQLRAMLHERAKLTAEIGVAAGKFPALAASIHGGVTFIQPGHERAFLASKPVSLLPLTSDEQRRLGLFGLQTLGQLAALPRAAVTAQFGRRGRLLHQLACGDDPRPLHPYQPPQIERIHRRWCEPLADEAQFERALGELAAEACARLRAGGSTCGRLSLCLTFEDGAGREHARALREPVADERALKRLLVHLSAALPRAGVIRLDLELADLRAEAPQQLRLFDAPQAKKRSARELAQTLSARHGCTPFVQAVMPDEADLLPETLSFLPLEEP
jgi:protein ImuB